MKKLGIYKKIPKDYSDRQNVCMSAGVCMYVYAHHP